MTDQRATTSERPMFDDDLVDRYSGSKDELFFRLGFQAALRVCAIAEFDPCAPFTAEREG